MAPTLYQPAPLPLRLGAAGDVARGRGAAAGALLARLGMPNAFMFGPLAVAIALTIGEVQFSSLPTGLSNAAQVLLGCALGARFERRSLQSAPRYVCGVLASVAVAIVVAAAVRVPAGCLASGLPLPTLVLAMAPGGIAEMCITAKVLQLGVPLVTAAQVTRVLVLLTTHRSGLSLAAPLAGRLSISHCLSVTLSECLG